MASLLVSTDADGNVLIFPTTITTVLYTAGAAITFQALQASGMFDGKMDTNAFSSVFEDATQYTLLAIFYPLVAIGTALQLAHQASTKSIPGVLGFVAGGVVGWYGTGWPGWTMLGCIFGGLFGGSALKKKKRRAKGTNHDSAHNHPEPD